MEYRAWGFVPASDEFLDFLRAGYFTGVMGKNQQRVLVETYKLDGVEYEVVADREQGHYWGSWTCLANGQTGGSSAKCKSPGEAIRVAQGNLSTYHWHTFGQGAKA